MRCILIILLTTRAVAHLDPLEHLGGNSPFFSGPNVFDSSPEPPAGCVVDQAAFVSRHGSRYPDPSAYYQWTNLSAKIQSHTFETGSPELEFLHNWKPVLHDPDHEISLLSPGGWKELYDMGVDYRRRYPDLYTETEPFALWANRYQDNQPRVIDSARLFARGYLGPDAPTLGTVLVVNNSDPRSFFNSLAPSDLCPSYQDNSGGDNATRWANIYLPPIVDRINRKLLGLQFNSSDVVIFPYLCGFESQITGKRSPWCDVFTDDEILQYEYAQDIRYWYGNGLGSAIGSDMMLPLLSEIVQRFVDGPNAEYGTGGNSTFKPNKLIAAFTNDGQINQLVSGMGIFDAESQLPSDHIPSHRLYRSSRFVTMRGTASFERLNCGSAGLFLRLKLNDQVYPVAGCQSGPGRTCRLEDYQALVKNKLAAISPLGKLCGIGSSSPTVADGQFAPFLEDPSLPFVYPVTP